jgi:UTP:GlnB (protein PII) uridylyltransferase
VGSIAGVVVRFVESESGALTVLEIESTHDADLIVEVRRVLYAIGVNVQRVELRPGTARLIGRLHLSDQAGVPIDEDRRLTIQDRVLQVVLAEPHKTQPPGATGASMIS